MKNNKAWLFVLPALLLLTAFAFIPMFQVLYYSFLKYNIFEEPVFVGVKNYTRLFHDPKFFWTLLNSLIFILVTPVMMVVSLMLALLVRQNKTINKFFRSVYFLPVVTPIVIAGIIWRWIFAEDSGLMNYLLAIIHIPKVSWLTSYPTNIVSIMILTVWRGMGYYMMIFLSGIALIPKEVEEACRLDGANKFQQVIHIIVPMIKPVLVLVFVTSSTAAVKMFTELYIMTPGTPMTNKTMVYYLFYQAFERFDFGYGSAAGVVLFLLTLGFSYTNIRLMEK
ncbi:MAG: carbohydrate ABC transporter permease [Bacteroidota bacterium]